MSLTKATTPPGTQVPPIEHLGEHLGDASLNVPLGTIPPTPKNALRTANVIKNFPDKNTKSVYLDLVLARTAWDAVMGDLGKGLLTITPRNLEKRPGFTNGSKDWRSFRFNEVAVESVEMDTQGVVVLSLSSPNPKATARGLEKYQKRIALTLSKFYGCNATLRLQSQK